MVMWLGELITQRGVGNGMSILIFTSIISRLPSEGHAILLQGGTAKFVVILLIGLGDHRRRSSSWTRGSVGSRSSTPNGSSAAG